MRSHLLLASGLSCLATSCGGGSDSTAASPPPEPALSIMASPSHASMFGQIEVSLRGDFARLGQVRSVTVNGIAALDVHASSSLVTFVVQGAPQPGPATVVLEGTGGQHTDRTALTFDPPVGKAPPVWAAFGASLTQGFQSGGLTSHGQRMSWDAQIARSAGVFLALPLVVDGLLPPLEPAAFAKNCKTSWSESSIADGVLSTLTDPTTHQIDLDRARQDPALATRNFAVGGARVADIIRPASGFESVIERITELPAGDPLGLLGRTVARSQIARLVTLDPDIAVSTDLLANDSDGAVTASDDLHPELITPLAKLVPELDELAMRLGETHGQYFIGNLLPIDGLPNVAVLRRQTIAKGTETEASFDAKLATIQGMVQSYNDALAKALALYPNLHIVDVWTPTKAVLANGLEVAGVKLTGLEFGGLLSLDFIHFTDTGYAFLANVFIDEINRVMEIAVPKVDVTAVLSQDALSPPSLARDGVRCKQP